MKLGKRLFISFLAVIFVVTLSIGIGAPFLIKEFLIESRKTELNDKGVDLIRFVRDFQEDRITYWQFGRLINNLDHFLGARIWILDDQDHLIFASEDASDNDEEDIPSPLGPPPLPWNSSAPFASQQTENYDFSRIPLESIAGGNEISAFLKDQNRKSDFFRHHPYYKEDMLVVVVPYNATRVNSGGTIIFHFPLEAIDHMLNSIYIYLGISVILAIGVASILAQFLTRTIAGPLLTMKTSAGAMAQGNYNLHITPRGPEEVQELAQSFNHLAYELDTNMKELEKQETLRRDFIANVSHELRTPLTIMRGFTEALLDGVITEPKQIDSTYHTMRDETVRLSKLITELLDLSRMQASSVVMPLSPINLIEIVENAFTLFEQPCQAKEVLLEMAVPQEAGLINGNGDRLTQLLLILLDNALKFTPIGGTISIDLEETPAEQILTLSDTGSGIPAEDLPYIWERFYKSDKSRQRDTNNPSGTGLGLAIAKEIIEKHSATVKIESSPKKGTSFIIAFPRNIEKE